MKWYIVPTFTGAENQVKTGLEEKIKSSRQEDHFGRIGIPMESAVELKQGMKRTSRRKYYPGYIMVEMSLREETWHSVRRIPKVTGFVGGDVLPAPIPDQEAERILQQMEEGLSRSKPKYTYEEGDEVRVVDGLFSSCSSITSIEILSSFRLKRLTFNATSLSPMP